MADETLETQTLCARLDAALVARAPWLAQRLRAPVSEEGLASVEDVTGLRLPEALRVLLAHHDGDGGSGLLGDGFTLLSAVQIIEHWRLHVQVAQAVEFEMPDEIEADVAGELDPRVRTRIGSHRWLPFANCNGDVTRYIDFDPTPHGTLGQVIEVDPEGLSWRCLASSFATYLADHVAKLERGEVEFDPPGVDE